MPFSVTCPGCESVYPMGENLIGKTIRCKKCGEMIQVSAPAAAKAAPAAKPRPKPAVVSEDDEDDDAPPVKSAKRPARAAVADDDDEDDDEDDAPRRGKSQKKGVPIPLIVGGLAAVLIVGGGLAAYFAFSGDGSDIAQNDPPGNTNRAVPPPNETPRGTPLPDRDPGEAATKVPPTVPPPAPKKEPPPPPKSGPGNNTATQTTTLPPPPPPPAVTNPTSSGLSNRDYMLGKMDRLTLEKVKRAAVMIRTDTDTGGGEGSGWFGVEPGLVFTNAHVIGMKGHGSKEPRKLTLFLNAGTPEQREIEHHRLKILAVDREIDLAVLQVIGVSDLPVPLKVKPSLELLEGQGLSTVGFPFGTKVSMAVARTKKAPEVSIRPSTFTAFRRDAFGQPLRIQVEGGIYTGNSGGAIVDAEGTVCGVVVEVLPDYSFGGGQTQIGLGVPTEYVFGLLSGRIGEVEYKMPYRDNGKVRLPVVIHCLDPLNRLNSVGIAGWVGDSSDKYRRPGATKPDQEPGDSDFQKISLKYDQKTKTATGELVMPELAPGRAYWVQPVYSNSSNPEYWMPGTRIPVKGPPVDRTPADLMVKFKPGARRTITMSNASDFNEYAEGEGEAKNERETRQTSLKVVETVFPGEQEFAARLRLTFENVEIKAKLAELEIDAVPKEILTLINQFAKLAQADGWVTRDGQIARYQVNTMSIQDPVGKFLVTALGSNAIEALRATSIPLPNRRVNAGDKWESVTAVRLSLGFTRVNKATGKLQQQVKEYKYQNRVTYTYVGQRERAGKKEAVVLIEGKVERAPGAKETASGALKGMALVELDSGTVVDAELENEIELDTSGDGLKKKVSGISQYKVSRGSSAQ